MAPIRWLSGILALCVASAAYSDVTTLTIPTTTQDSSTVPVTMSFPITRTDDLSYKTILDYHTVDGTALAGTDYMATSGTITIPSGGAAATLPVTILPTTGISANTQFQMVVDSVVGIGPTPAFATQQTFATGTAPYSVTVADVNGDGKPDLIVANHTQSSVSVLLNITPLGAFTPVFATQQTFATGTGPYSVTVADVNGDGKPDLIVANQSSNNVSVLLNTTATGDTTLSFASQQTFATGVYPYSVTAVDVNGDGKPDLITANNYDSTVSVLLNTTAPGAAMPSFAAQVTFPTGDSPNSVIADDVNGDGKPDLIVATSVGVSVLLNTTASGATAPSLATQQTFVNGNFLASVTTADVNGDGEPDLIVADEGNNTVSVLLNTTAPGATTPSFAAQQAFGAGTGPYSVAADDVNGDGKPDLIVTNYFSNNVSVLRNTTVPGAATARFDVPQTFATGTYPISLAVADVNGDGQLDLIIANQFDDNVSVLLATTAAGAALGFAGQPNFAVGVGPRSVTAADLNGDGKPEVITANYYTNNVSVLLDTTATGAVAASFATQQVFATGVGPYSVTVADVNGDGMPDLIAANQTDNNVSVLLNTTAPGATTLSFTTQQTFATGVAPYSVIAADVNGDGKPDLIVANYNDGNVSVLLNTTAPGETTPSFATQHTFAAGTGPFSVAAADVNGDGKPDLIVANQTSNNVSVLLNITTPGALTPSFAPQQTFAVAFGPDSVATADLNGDGRPDLIVANGAGLSVLFNITPSGAPVSAFTAEQTVSTVPFGVNVAGPFFANTADLNGDGKPDIMVVINSSNAVSVLVNTMTPGSFSPSFAKPQLFATDNLPASVTAADVNGDGKPDLIVGDSGHHMVSVFLNTQYQATVSGSPATGTIVHDYIFANGFGP